MSDNCNREKRRKLQRIRKEKIQEVDAKNHSLADPAVLKQSSVMRFFRGSLHAPCVSTTSLRDSG